MDKQMDGQAGPLLRPIWTVVTEFCLPPNANDAGRLRTFYSNDARTKRERWNNGPVLGPMFLALHRPSLKLALDGKWNPVFKARTEQRN